MSQEGSDGRPAWRGLPASGQSPRVGNTNKGPSGYLIFAVLGILLVIALVLTGIFAFKFLGNVTASFDTAMEASAAELRASGISMAAIEKVGTTQYVDELKAQGPQALDKFALLGAIISIGKCSEVSVEVRNSDGNGTAACPTTFDRGAATLVLELQLQDGHWKLSGLNIQI